VVALSSGSPSGRVFSDLARRIDAGRVGVTDVGGIGFFVERLLQQGV